MPTTGTRDEWQAARRELLDEEKALTRRSDELARRRRELPWVPVEEPYRFETTTGSKTLAELFDGRSQLVVYHFMHGPKTPDGCPGCTYAADGFDRVSAHLAAHDVTFLCASRSPLDVLQDYRRRFGWDFEWVSSGDSGFEADIGELLGGSKMLEVMELMALSAFALEGGVVHHTYSTFDRGTDALNPVWQLLDRAPRGRDDEAHPGWPRRRDEYEAAVA